jgi:hypothetical protein
VLAYDLLRIPDRQRLFVVLGSDDIERDVQLLEDRLALRRRRRE